MPMRFLLYAALLISLFGALSGSVFAAPVTVLKDGDARTYNDRFLPSESALGEPRYTAPADEVPAVTTAAAAVTIEQAMTDLVASGQLPQSEYDQYIVKLDAARAAYKTLKGTRRKELGAVINNMKSIAASGILIQ